MSDWLEPRFVIIIITIVGTFWLGMGYGEDKVRIQNKREAKEREQIIQLAIQGRDPGEGPDAAAGRRGDGQTACPDCGLEFNEVPFGLYPWEAAHYCRDLGS